MLEEIARDTAIRALDLSKLDVSARSRVADLFFAATPHAPSNALLRRLASDDARRVRIAARASMIQAKLSVPLAPEDSEARAARELVRARQRARFSAIRPLTDSPAK